jgi:uncharacterized damage-inducible protein DinB
MEMTPERASSLARFLISQFEDEMKATRNVLAAVPSDKADYRPDPKSKSALELAAHVAAAEAFFLNAVIKGSFERPATSPAAALKTPEEVVAFYDANVPEAINTVKELSGEHLAQPVTAFTSTFPNVMLLNIGLKHGVHHRGQLSTYLRPMGAKVPSIYGTSADSDDAKA